MVEEIVIWLTKIWNIVKRKGLLDVPIGEAIGCDNPFLYKVEIDFEKHKASKIEKGELVYMQNGLGESVVGIIVNDKQLLNKKRLSIYFLQDEEGNAISVNVNKRSITGQVGNIFFKDNFVYGFNLSEVRDEAIRQKIENNYFYKNKDKFIGYVSHGSNIHQIHFELLINKKNSQYNKLKEGSIIKADIQGKDVLYQIIDGVTYEEILDKHDKYGYMTGVAQKLGQYDSSLKEIKTVKRVPSIYAPVFFDTTEPSASDLNKSIGELPETNLEVEIKNFDDLVTHNTAILGILGIGKSCLTFELIKKVLDNTGCKIICIDVTNEYKEKLAHYFNVEKIISDDENSLNQINGKFEYIHEEGGAKNYEKSGNVKEYKQELKKDICNFLFGIDDIPENKQFDADKRIRILNPDYHKASKGEKIGFNVITTELSQAEKTRIIAEGIFGILMKLGISEDKKAKVLIVLEEAHSLVPERNSTANEGDKSAVNGTAKVILQGRKYGLGSFVITQRTANISKSILNQCNTIFALRVFDDTGKQFLENYIGSSYANTLPTLEERYAIAVGKALKLKQPIIIKLNDKDDIVINEDQCVL